jgi:2-polyprenyl-6-methoxyphenol hydroxylase-like FAD-dependent oxidoreductase
MAHVHTSEVLIIGGGPAGSALARLLAMRGHAVGVATRPIDDRRGLAESLPPSTRKVMAAVGIVDAVERSGACRNVGNAVWWGSGDGRVEDFDAPGDATGLQVWRPEFDRLLAAEARAAGAGWTNGNVTDVDFDDPSGDVLTTVVTAQGTRRIASQFVVDASGRSGVLARSGRQPLPGRRTHAWIGTWTCPTRSALAAETRTLVETTDQGWVWSVPTSTTERCVTVMVDPDRSTFARRR